MNNSDVYKQTKKQNKQKENKTKQQNTENNKKIKSKQFSFFIFREQNPKNKKVEVSKVRKII